MPCYTYKCESCGKIFDAYPCIADRNEPKECECGGSAVRDAETELASSGGVDATMQDHIRYSNSMGVMPWQVDKARKMYPGSEYLPDGRLVIKNRTHKKLEMKRRGFEEYN